MSVFKDKTLLITGGTGSFGTAVVEKFLNTGISEIRIFSRDEKKQDDMRRAYTNPKLKFFIGDVRDPASVSSSMHGVDYVFHAAALKQVPSCEFFPLEAVKTNILGAENVLNAAISNGVRKVVCLSTDKAVYPINAMGMSKALMEKVFVAKSRIADPEKTLICGTRYGNVMGSRGSVIPLFMKQIITGQPLTVTDPEMTRYLMFIEEAVELVLFAFENARQGDIFVQKAPACTIGTLAKAMKELFESDSPIQVIGTRHGEKLFETLLSREEMALAEDLGGHFRIPADTRDLNYEKYFNDGSENLSRGWDYTSHNTQRLSLEETKKELKKIPLIRKEITSYKRPKQ